MKTITLCIKRSANAASAPFRPVWFYSISGIDSQASKFPGDVVTEYQTCEVTEEELRSFRGLASLAYIAETLWWGNYEKKAARERSMRYQIDDEGLSKLLERFNHD